MSIILVFFDELLNDELLVLFSIAMRFLKPLNNLLFSRVSDNRILWIRVDKDNITFVCHEIILDTFSRWWTNFDVLEIDFLPIRHNFVKWKARNLFSLPDQRMSHDIAILIFQFLLDKSIWRVDDVEMVLLFVHGDQVDFIILALIVAQSLLPSLDDLCFFPYLFFSWFAADEELRNGRFWSGICLVSQFIDLDDGLSVLWFVAIFILRFGHLIMSLNS